MRSGAWSDTTCVRRAITTGQPWPWPPAPGSSPSGHERKRTCGVRLPQDAHRRPVGSKARVPSGCRGWPAHPCDRPQRPAPDAARSAPSGTLCPPPDRRPRQECGLESCASRWVRSARPCDRFRRQPTVLREARFHSLFPATFSRCGAGVRFIEANPRWMCALHQQRVPGRLLLCWASGTGSHLAKAPRCAPGVKPQMQHTPTSWQKK
jgi:hypothetical protein